MNTKTENGTNVKLSITASNDASIANGSPSDFSLTLPRSGLKLVRCLSKEWSMCTARLVFDKIRLASTDQAISSLRALSSHEYLRQIPFRLRVEAKPVGPNLSVHQSLQHLLR